MREKIITFINDLIVYDYILFGASFALFILFIVLAIVIRKKLIAATMMLLLGFIILLLLPTFGYIQMHKYLYKNSCEVQSHKRLTFVDAIVVKGVLHNESKFDFTQCRVTASAYKVSANPVKKVLYPLNPMKKMSIVQENIPKDSSREFKIIVEPFYYKGEYNISVGAKCR